MLHVFDGDLPDCIISVTWGWYMEATHAQMRSCSVNMGQENRTGPALHCYSKLFTRKLTRVL